MADQGHAIVTIAEHHDAGGCHLVLRGRLDVRTVADLRMPLQRVIAEGSTPLLLDLGEVHVGDATGFGFIVECLRRSRRAGRPMRIVTADDRTRRLLRRARLGAVLGAVAEPVDVPATVALAGAPG